MRFLRLKLYHFCFVAICGLVFVFITKWSPHAAQPEAPSTLTAGYAVQARENPWDGKQLVEFNNAGEPLGVVQNLTLVAPIELRCPGPYPNSMKDPCHRSHAIKNNKGISQVLDSIHRLCGTTPNLYVQHYVGYGNKQSTHCDLIVSRDSLALGATNHMHLRGRSMKIELNPGFHDARVLVYRTDWNTTDQRDTWFYEPVPLKRGDILRITCVFDNTKAVENSNGQMLEPRYLLWGENINDGEICLSSIHWIGL